MSDAPLTKSERRRLASIIAIGAAITLTAAAVTGTVIQRAHDQGVIERQAVALSTVDPVRTAPVIPRCIYDDFNDGTQALCYTVTTDGRILVIDQHDEVVS